MNRRIELATAAVILLAATVALFVSSPHDGQFWWSDAPRHALNGAFVKDFIAAHPWHDPAAWAMQYYVKYPALTILFYPPLFYFILAPFYAVFGVSNGTAIAVVLVHYFALAFGLYVLARRWVSAPLAVLAGLSAFAAPAMAEWGRQVMLEIPTLAYAIWGVVLLRDYADSGRRLPLYFGTFLLLCALYTKLNTVFLLPVVAVMLFAGRGNRLWRDKHVWIAAGLAAIGILPLIWLTLRFGSANVQSVAGISDAVVPRDSIAGWTWYARQLPWRMGWPLLFGAVLWPIAVMVRRDAPPRLAKPDAVLLLGWIAVGYVFFSGIALKDSRYATQFIPPLLVLAMLALAKLLPQRAAIVAGVVLVAGTAWQTAQFAPVPMVEGYREAAEYIAREAPKDAVVVFSGKRDGSFIFNMRTGTRHDISILRSDKLLLDISVRRTLGVQEKSLTEQQISDLLDRDGVSYVVAQDDFWTDLPEMARFQSILRSDHFKQVAEIPVVANVPVEDGKLLIYRNTRDISSGPHMVDLHLPIIGQTVKGSVGR